MAVASRRFAGVLTVGIAVLIAAAGSASAATTTPFGCRASTTRVAALNSLLVEPTIANPGTTPCKTDTAGASTVSVPITGASPVVAGPVGAFTYATNSGFAPGAASLAAVDGVTLPSPNGGSIVVVGPIQAQASYACVNDKLVAAGSATVNVITINGTATTVPTGTPQTIPLGGGSYLAVNEQITTSNSLTERAIDLHISGLADIVVAEAQVTQSKTDPCAGTSGPPPVLGECPPGSTLNIAAQMCEIVINNPNGTTTIIVVSKPFQGPSGGTVYPTSVVAKKYPGFPCTTGPGPKFALVATKRGGRVYGTAHSDRILALGAYERIAALGGNDCVNGAGGNQIIFDGNGNDRLWAGPGFNRVSADNGNDYVNGRNGRDWITLGNGRNTVYGGHGNSRIDLGLGGGRVFGGPGSNRIWAGGNHYLVNCGSGKRNTAFVRNSARKYAATHGCQKVFLL